MLKSDVRRILRRIDNYQMKINELYHNLKEAGQDEICYQLEDNGIYGIIVDTSSMITAYKK